MRVHKKAVSHLYEMLTFAVLCNPLVSYLSWPSGNCSTIHTLYVSVCVYVCVSMKESMCSFAIIACSEV